MAGNGSIFIYYEESSTGRNNLRNVRNSLAISFTATLMHTKCFKAAFWRVHNSQS